MGEQKVLANGAIYDMEKGRIVANPGGGSHAITSATARGMLQKRQAKQAARLREQIAKETQAITNVKLSGSADAVAVAGGMLWAEVVLNADAYPRDRLDAWERLGKHAGILADPRQAEAAAGTSVSDVTDLVAALSGFVAQVRAARSDTTQGDSDTATEAEGEGEGEGG